MNNGDLHGSLRSTGLPDLPEPVREPCMRIARAVQAAGGRALLVGGWVRDAFLGYTSKDVDMEVYGLEPTVLERLLRRSFRIVQTGRVFGVFKLHGLPIDIALPRRESKMGLGHKGFRVEGDPYLPVEEAFLRRDFTINAIALDLLSSEVIDPCGGLADLRRRVLRHTGKQFDEDPLRVLRAMQFMARFELTAVPETVALCRQVEPEGLPAERLCEEWQKCLLKGAKPSLGLNFLQACGWMRYYPELAALIDCPQDPEWHPEGDVWVHTLHCLDAFARQRIGIDWEDLVVGFAVLCHDLGKPATTRFEEGRIRSKGHEAAGEVPTRAFLSRLTQHKALIAAVIPLVTNHLRPREFFLQQAGDSAIRRLARRVGRIDRLVRVARADLAGRPPLVVDDCPEGEWLLKRAEALAVKDAVPKPLVLGRHLLALGEQPGRHFKAILDRCYEAQLDGQFTDTAGGILWLRALLAGGLRPSKNIGQKAYWSSM